MSLLTTFRTPGSGKHRTATFAEKDHQIEQLTAALAESERAHQATAADLDAALAREAAKDRRLADADARLKTWAGKIVRVEAEHRRLRQAVINARPRITYAEPPLVPPYAALSLPYPVPVQGRDTSAETTQQMPILDLAGAL